jgi:hypothetical protein
VKVASGWSAGGFVALPSVLPLVLAAVSGAVGLQTMLGGFVLAIVGGHSAEFLRHEEPAEPVSPPVKQAKAA